MQNIRLFLKNKRAVLENAKELIENMDRWAGNDKAKQLVVMFALEDGINSISEKVQTKV